MKKGRNQAGRRFFEDFNIFHHKKWIIKKGLANAQNLV